MNAKLNIQTTADQDIKANYFKFDSSNFRSQTGLKHEWDQILKKLDWYFEELQAVS